MSFWGWWMDGFCFLQLEPDLYIFCYWFIASGKWSAACWDFTVQFECISFWKNGETVMWGAVY